MDKEEEVDKEEEEDNDKKEGAETNHIQEVLPLLLRLQRVDWHLGHCSLVLGLLLGDPLLLREAISLKKQSKYGHCPNWLNTPPSIFGSRGALFTRESRHFAKSDKTA